jgi:hypothetical protein
MIIRYILLISRTGKWNMFGAVRLVFVLCSCLCAAQVPIAYLLVRVNA